MARKRLVSPEFFMHSGLYDAEFRHGLPLRLAFAGLWTVADRRGVFTWKVMELKLAILPYDPVDFGAVLNALAVERFLTAYVVDGKQYGHIPSLKNWQTFHHHEKPSNAPGPDNARSEPASVEAEPTNGRLNPTVTVTVTGTGTGTEELPSQPQPRASYPISIVSHPNGNGRALATTGPKGVATIKGRLATVFAEIADRTRTTMTADQLRRHQSEVVFLYWSAKFDHAKALLDGKRERRIVARLRENDGDVSELLYALDGASHDDWIMGRDAKSTRKYDDIDTILRDRGQVERFASTRKGYKNGTPHKLIGEMEAAIASASDEDHAGAVLTNGSGPEVTP